MKITQVKYKERIKMPELYTTPSVADVAMRNHMKGDNMKSERNWRIKMDKTTSEMEDRTRKALMDRIVELERDKKTLEEKNTRSREGVKQLFKRIAELVTDKKILAQIGKEAQQTVLDLTDENNRLEEIIGIQQEQFAEWKRARKDFHDLRLRLAAESKVTWGFIPK
jgi:hypothetical protein